MEIVVAAQIIIDGFPYFAMSGPWATGRLQFTEVDGLSDISAVFSDDAQLGLFDASVEGGDPISDFIGIVNIQCGFSRRCDCRNVEQTRKTKHGF